MSKTNTDISTIQFSQNPYKVYEELRKTGNVHYLKSNNTWLIIGYNEITNILTNSAIYSSEGDSPFDPILLNCDPPEHTKNRKIIGGDKALFSPNRIEDIEQKNREICREILDSLVAKDGFDILKDFCLPFSSLVVLRLLGITTTENETLRNWSSEAVSSKAIFDTNYALEKWNELKPIVEEWIQIAIQKKGSEGLSEIIFHKNSEDHFSYDNILNLTKVLLLGGNETTPNLISSALLILFKTPSLFKQIIENTNLIPNLINETLRLEAPTQIIQRTNKEEVTIGIHTIPKNSSISLALGAANRDPEIFDLPNEFILDRKKGKILSFGYGPHYCIGAQLAKQEAQIALEELFNYFPEICLSPSFKSIYRNSSHIRGLEKMPVFSKQDRTYAILLQRKNAISLLEKGMNENFEFPTFEFYPNQNTSKKDWHITYPSPFIHSNILYSLMNSSVINEDLIKKGTLFLLKSAEKGGVFRFWKLENSLNKVPPDIDDTAMCSFVLEKEGHKLNNKKILLKNIKNDGRLLTWILPSWNLLIVNPYLCLKLLFEKKAVANTIKSGMLHQTDTEVGVAVNALLYLGENKYTKKAIEYCITVWENDNDKHHFYEHKIVIAYHFARAYKEGITTFIKVSNTIEKRIQKEKDTYSFAELLLSYLCLKYFKTNDSLTNEIKALIIKNCETNQTLFENYPYFTSKDRNYCAGSYCLTASWFLEATQDWTDE